MQWDALVISDLLSPEDNPEGYVFASLGVAICGALLLPAARLVQSAGWSVASPFAAFAGWSYRTGLVAAIAVGLPTPFQEIYGQVHIHLAFVAFMGLTAGLAIAFMGAARVSRKKPLGLTAMSVLYVSLFAFLAHLFFLPNYFVERRWLLGVYEWICLALISVGTIILTLRGATHVSD